MFRALENSNFKIVLLNNVASCFFVIPGAQGPLMLHCDLEAGGGWFPSSPSGVAHVLTKEKFFSWFRCFFLHFLLSLPWLWCPPAPPAAASTRRSRTKTRFACCTKGTGAGIWYFKSIFQKNDREIIWCLDCLLFLTKKITGLLGRPYAAGTAEGRCFKK